MSDTPRRTPQNVLVTGGCGFIGSAFIRWLLAQKDFSGKLVNLDALTYAANPENVADVPGARYTFVHGDIRDDQLLERLIREHGVDTIVHFAAETHVDRSIHAPDLFIQTNVVGTQRLLEAVRAVPHVHFHHVSTDEVYGSLGPSGYFTETTPYQPSSPYSASKAASDHLVRAYAHTYGLSTTISNSSNNYGPYQFPEKLVPLMILNLVEGAPLPIYGDGLNVRDWLYVEDHADAVWRIVRDGAQGQTYNVGGRAEWTNLALVQRLIEIVAAQTARDAAALQRQLTFVSDRPGHDRRYAIDCGKLERELGWRPRHDIDAGLDATVRWYLANTTWVQSVRSGAYRDWIERNYARR